MSWGNFVKKLFGSSGLTSPEKSTKPTPRKKTAKSTSDSRKRDVRSEGKGRPEKTPVPLEKKRAQASFGQVDEDNDDDTPSRGELKTLQAPALISEGSASQEVVSASEQDKERLLAFDGEVLTGEKIPLNDAARKLCAYLANGWFVVEESSELSSIVLSVRQSILKQGHKITRTYLVNRQTVRLIYKQYENRFGSGKRGEKQSIGGVDIQHFQKVFFDLVRESALKRVSDIHVFIGQYEADVVQRVNGTMVPLFQKEAAWAHSLCSTAFAMADAADATYKIMEYQGARVSNIRAPLPAGVQSIRLQFNPLPNGGRYMVARLLYETSDATGSDLDSLGYNQCQMEQLRSMRKQSYGINVISGPTGSGKSTTLVRALTALMAEKPGINIITIEDPPEYVIPGVAQLPVLNASTAEERKSQFTKAISAALRSDPDVIMIGEIRDNASAGLAFEAAMTGHQVYASLHANTASSILSRLRDIKVELYKLTDPTLMTGLIGQRLMKQLCPNCKRKFTDVPEEELLSMGYDRELIAKTREIAGDRIDGVYVANPEGCEENRRCRGGIAGRVVIAETIRPDETFMEYARNENYTKAIQHWLDELNGLTMQEHALQKMTKGMSAPLDVEGIAGDFNRFDMKRREKVFGELYN